MSRPSMLNPSGAVAPMLAVLASMVSLTLGASIAKSLFPVVGAIGSTALRLALGAIILSIVFRVWRVRLDRRVLLAAVPYGVCLGAMNVFFYLALQTIPLGVAIAIELTGPLTVAIFATRRLRDLTWAGLAIAGLLFLLPMPWADSALDPVGFGFALAAGVLWGAYIILGKRAGAALGQEAPALGLIAAALVVLPLGIAEAGADLLRPEVLAVGFVVALFSSAIPYSLEMFALRRLPASSFGVLTSAEPAIGAIMGLILLGETLGPQKWLGIGAIVLASIGTARAAYAVRKADGHPISP